MRKQLGFAIILLGLMLAIRALLGMAVAARDYAAQAA